MQIQEYDSMNDGLNIFVIIQEFFKEFSTLEFNQEQGKSLVTIQDIQQLKLHCSLKLIQVSCLQFFIFQCLYKSFVIIVIIVVCSKMRRSNIRI